MQTLILLHKDECFMQCFINIFKQNKKKYQKAKAHIPENTEATPVFILLQNLIFSGG